MNMTQLPASEDSLRSLLIGSRRATGSKLIKLKIVYGTTAYNEVAEKVNLYKKRGKN